MKYLKKFKTNTDYQTFKESSGWITPNVSVIENDNIIKYTEYVKPYLAFKAIEDSTFKLTQNACEYSLDKGKTWVSLAAETDTPTVSAGSTIMFKATNPSNTGAGIGTFSSTGKFDVEGNIMSMLYGDDAFGQNDLTSNDFIFGSLFSSCINLINASNLQLPATTLSNYCYAGMFAGCTGLTTAPKLPGTTLATSCYYLMFAACTSLTAAPELPATTLAKECYSAMFYGCMGLTSAPELPATTLADSCYHSMFYDCYSLATAPELPATTLAMSCYSDMFVDCSSLTTAPELPATTLSTFCYQRMFMNCYSLTAAPELPATILVDNCYTRMFYGCRALNNIVMLATDINAIESLYNWVYGVASTGTFVKHKDMTSLSTGNNGIPSGWEVIDY